MVDDHMHFLTEIPFNRNCSIEALVWCKDQCFSAASDGSVSKHSVGKLSPLDTRQISASPIWCMTKNSLESLLAVGSDDGTVHLITVEDELFDCQRSFPGFMDSRILCLEWHPSENVLVGGSLDAIQLWDVQNGRSLRTISVARGRNKHLPTVVWCLAVSSDFTVISGDSLGRVCFWDGRYGTLIGSHSVHEADVLALSLEASEKRLFAAGIDPKIQQFDAINQYRKKQKLEADVNKGTALLPVSWTPNFVRNLHSHDVRALTSFGHWLVSGGVDSFIGLSRFPPRTFLSFPPINTAKVCVACDARLILLRHQHSLDIWKLGKEKKAVKEPVSTCTLEIEDSNERLVEIRSRHRLVASSVSDDGSLVAYSSDVSTKIFKLDINGKEPFLSPLKCTNVRTLPPGNVLKFGSNPSALLIGCDDGYVRSVGLTSSSCSLDASCRAERYGRYVRLLAVSSDSSRCAAVCGENVVSVISLSKMELLSVRKWNRLVLGIEFSSEEALVVLFGDGSLDEVGSSLKSSTAAGRALWKIPSRKHDCEGLPKIGLSVSKCNQEKVIMTYSPFSLTVISVEEDGTNLSIHRTARYKYLYFVGGLSDGSVTVVELDPESYRKKLPPALKLKKFGTG